MAIGGFNAGNRAVETVLNNGRWAELGYVYVGSSKALYYYSTVTINDYLYIFGTLLIT